MVGAVIFDFDGVITDSEILHLRCFNKVLAQFGFEIEKTDYYKNYLGLSDFELFTLLIEKGEIKLADKTIEDLIAEKNQIYEKIAVTEGKTIEGVHDFIKLLAANNIPMAIYSGSLLSEIMLILEQANLHTFFSIVVSAEDVKKGKPDPEGFLIALQRLNDKLSPAVSADQCIVIEDSHWGLESTATAGMHTVAVTNSYSEDELRLAEKTVDNLSELTIDYLNKLCE